MPPLRLLRGVVQGFAECSDLGVREQSIGRAKRKPRRGKEERGWGSGVVQGRRLHGRRGVFLTASRRETSQGKEVSCALRRV